MTPLKSSTDFLIQEARRRGIVVAMVAPVDRNLVQLELGDHRERLYFTSTDHLGAATRRAFEDKVFTTNLLRRAGFPVPEEILTDSLAEAADWLRERGRVVVKPLSNTGGAGITTGVATEDLLAAAFERARAASTTPDARRRAIIQEHVEGNDCRILVVNQQQVFAIERVPAYVVGDGRQTILALVEAWNATRLPECGIQLNEAALELLAAQGLATGDVSKEGQRVRLAYVSNYHAGGRLRDITDELGEKIVATARRVASYFNVPIVGIDFMTPDPRVDPGVIIELNGTPDITIHHKPDEGTPRNAAAAVLDMLFPETVS